MASAVVVTLRAPASMGPMVDEDADHLVLRTDSDWLLDIIRFVVLRRKRMEGRVSK